MRRLTISLHRCLAKLSLAGAGALAPTGHTNTWANVRRKPTSWRPDIVLVPAVEKRKTRMHMYESEESTSVGPAQLFAKRIGQDKASQMDEGRWSMDAGRGQTKLHELAKNERKDESPLPRRWANNGGASGANSSSPEMGPGQEEKWEISKNSSLTLEEILFNISNNV